MHIMQTIVCVSISYLCNMIGNFMTVIKIIIKTRNKYFLCDFDDIYYQVCKTFGNKNIKIDFPNI